VTGLRADDNGVEADALSWLGADKAERAQRTPLKGTSSVPPLSYWESSGLNNKK
jgi:hypothetical protein